MSCQVGLAGVLESRTRTARGQGVRAGACGLREGVGSLARPPAGAVSARAGGAARMRGLLQLRPGKQHGKGCDGRGGQIFSAKGQINILRFEGHTLSVATTPIYRRDGKAATDTT